MISSFGYRKISRQKVLVCDLVKEMMLMQGDWYGMKEGPLVFNLGQGDLFARKSLPRKILAETNRRILRIRTNVGN